MCMLAHTHTYTQAHLDECPKLPVTCEQCQEKLEREKVRVLPSSTQTYVDVKLPIETLVVSFVVCFFCLFVWRSYAWRVWVCVCVLEDCTVAYQARPSLTITFLRWGMVWVDRLDTMLLYKGSTNFQWLPSWLLQWICINEEEGCVLQTWALKMALLTFWLLNAPVVIKATLGDFRLMTSAAFSQNIGKLFSELRLITDNLPHREHPWCSTA